jgi:hypothetical protein
MYIRTPHAMVWVEAPLEQAHPIPKAATKGHTPYQERWAKKPLNTAKGRCVALRQSAGKLELGSIRNNRLIWLLPTEMLSEWQLQNWLREGF